MDTAPSLFSNRLCQGECGLPILQARLKAMPNARLCVQCLTKAGDVAVIRRFDEYTPDGDRVETMFTHDRTIERQMRRSNTIVPNDEHFYTAVADDSHLTREIDSVRDVARPLSTVVTAEPETQAEYGAHKHRPTMHVYKGGVPFEITLLPAAA